MAKNDSPTQADDASQPNKPQGPAAPPAGQAAKGPGNGQGPAGPQKGQAAKPQGPAAKPQGPGGKPGAQQAARAAQAAKAAGPGQHPNGQAAKQSPAKPQGQPAKPQPAKPRVQPQRPAVSRSRFRWRHFWVLVSFALMVVGPSVVSGVYLWTVAKDQYASSVGFSVRREDASSPTDVLVGLSGFSGSSSTDTDILFEYLQSQKLVREMDDELDLRAIWSLPTDEEVPWVIPSEDPVFALKPDASIEDLMAYWDRVVKVSYASGSGLIEVEVRAFSAEEATSVAERLFAKSSEMINELSAVAREDGIRYTATELSNAEDRLRTAREVLTRFRNVNQIVDPELDLRSQASLLANLQEQKADSIIALDLLMLTVSDNDPRLVQERRRLQVIEDRISQERQKLGGSGQLPVEGDQGFANLIGEYETLVVDREFAEEAYISARAAHDSALSEARRQSRYLAAYLEPTTAQTAVYPQRITILIVITLFLFLLWSVVVLVFYSVKDRR